MATEPKKSTPAQKRTRKPATKKKRNTKAGSASANSRPADVSDAFPDSLSVSLTFETFAAGRFSHTDLDLSDEQVREMYENMLLQRRFEERAAQMYGRQKIGGFLHLYIGQEAVSTGAASAIRIGQDSVITAYRDHGLGLALGMSPEECMAEMFGKVGGCSKGKGGSMHFFSRENGLFGGHGIVGAHVPVGVGIAFAHKYKEDAGVCLAFFGDGAVGQGAIHEAANLASLYKLPIIFIIENNQYAMGTSIHRAFAETEFTRHAVGYDIPAALVDGMDVFSVGKAIQTHAKLARSGQPSLLEIRTYRYRGHSMSDPQKYRTKEELEARKSDDPIIRLKAYMLEKELIDGAQLDAVDERVKAKVLSAVDFAEQSPAPELDAIYDDIYAETDYPYLA